MAVSCAQPQNILVRDMGPDAAYEESVGQIPPQGGLQADGTESMEGAGRRPSLTPYGGCNDRGGVVRVGDIHLLSPEHSSTIY